jgi:hypothetical protein
MQGQQNIKLGNKFECFMKLHKAFVYFRLRSVVEKEARLNGFHQEWKASLI